MASSTGDSGVSDACVFVALALFGVWMQRQKVTTLSGSPTRWGAFFGAISGKYTIPSNTTSEPANSGADTSGSSGSATTAPNPNDPSTGGAAGAAASDGGKVRES